MANGTLKVENIQTSSGSGTITIGQSGETVSFPTGVSLTGNGISNKPGFLACLSADYSLADNVNTVIPLDAVYYNDDNVWNTSTYRFTAPSAGRYFFYAQYHCDDVDDADFVQTRINLNGSQDISFGGQTNREILQQVYASGAAQSQMPTCSVVLDLQKDDYVESLLRHNQGASQIVSYEFSYFMGYKLIG
jgi:hypothetical protein